MRQATKDLLVKTEAHLEGLSGQLIDELAGIAQGDWGIRAPGLAGKVGSLEIMVFTDGYRLALYALDRSSAQIGHRGLLKEGHTNGLLDGEGFNPDLDAYDFQNGDDNRELDEFDAAQKDIFIKWFTGCWGRTDKSRLAVPVYLSFHDTGGSLDLQTYLWTA